MTPAEVAAAIVVALGGATIIPKAINGLRAWRSGRAREEKAENQTLLARLTRAENRTEREINYRLRVETWAGRLEYMLAQLGVPQNKIPTKPEYSTRTKETA